VREAVAVAVGIRVGVAVKDGMAVAVSVAVDVMGIPVAAARVGTAAAMGKLQAVSMQTAARQIPVRPRNIFLLPIIHMPPSLDWKRQPILSWNYTGNLKSINSIFHPFSSPLNTTFYSPPPSLFSLPSDTF
jgi:hypothetical protein